MEDLYLPITIDATAFQLNLKGETQLKLGLKWLIGDDMKTLGALDPTQKDWREKLRVAFGYDWM